MRYLFQGWSLPPEAVPPAPSECLHTRVALCLFLGRGEGARYSYFCWEAEASYSGSWLSEGLYWATKGMGKHLLMAIPKNLYSGLDSMTQSTRPSLIQPLQPCESSLTVPPSLFTLPMAQPYGNCLPFSEHSKLLSTFGPLHSWSPGRFTCRNI